MKVLIVDDLESIRKVLTEMLEDNFPVECHKAENGLDAYILCTKNKYDLIITDHKMPFMMGSALIVAVRTKENLNKDTPIIMLSGFINEEMRKNLNIGKVDFISKPFEADELISKISIFIN